MHTVSRGAAILLAALILAAGCGSGHGSARPSAHPSTGPDTALVSWLGHFCTASDALLKMPAPIPHQGPTTEADRKPLLRFLFTARSALTAARDRFAALPTPPAPASALFTKYRKAIKSAVALDRKYTSYATSLPASQLTSVYTLASLDLGLFDPAEYPQPGTGGLDKYLHAHSTLAAAYRQAPACTDGASASPSG